MSETVTRREALARLPGEDLVAEAAAQAHLDDDGRARLERLAEGLRDLPEPGLSALILRELEGRDYEEVARLAHLTSTEARQEVFRARLELLGDVDGPTEHCDEIRAAMSKAEWSFRDRKSIGAHLEGCAVCSEFADELERRPSDLGLLFAPLPPPPIVPAAAAVVPELAAVGEGGGDNGGGNGGAPSANGGGRSRRRVGVPVLLALLLVGGGIALAFAVSGGGSGSKNVAVSPSAPAGTKNKQTPSGGGKHHAARRAHKGGGRHHAVPPPVARHAKKAHPGPSKRARAHKAGGVGSSSSHRRHKRAGGGGGRRHAAVPAAIPETPTAGYAIPGGSIEQQVSRPASRHTASARRRGGGGDSGLPITGLDLMLVVSAALILVGLGLSVRQLTAPRP